MKLRGKCLYYTWDPFVLGPLLACKEKIYLLILLTRSTNLSNYIKNKHSVKYIKDNFLVSTQHIP